MIVFSKFDKKAVLKHREYYKIALARIEEILDLFLLDPEEGSKGFSKMCQNSLEGFDAALAAIAVMKFHMLLEESNLPKEAQNAMKGVILEHFDEPDLFWEHMGEHESKPKMKTVAIMRDRDGEFKALSPDDLKKVLDRIIKEAKGEK